MYNIRNINYKWIYLIFGQCIFKSHNIIFHWYEILEILERTESKWESVFNCFVMKKKFNNLKIFFVDFMISLKDKKTCGKE